MIHRMLLASLALLASQPAHAQVVAKVGTIASGQYNLCRELALSVDDDLKEIAYLQAKDFLDDSAPRATMRAADRTAHLAQIQANLTMMLGLKCPLPDLPISDAVYGGAASECNLASAEDDIKTKCDRSTWAPGPRWSDATRPHY